jgi:hypothetical protein
MKPFKILMFLSAAIILASCEPGDEPKKDNSAPDEVRQDDEIPANDGLSTEDNINMPPPCQYYVWLGFRDVEGNDLIEGINCIEPEDTMEGELVDSDQYTLKSSPNLNELWKLENGSIFGWTPAEPINFTPYLYLGRPGLTYVASESDCYLLGILMSAAPWYDGYVDTITHTLTCPHIFGDDAEHEIVTHWRGTKDYEPYRVCYLVEVDGKEFTDITYAKGEVISSATIVLNR